MLAGLSAKFGFWPKWVVYGLLMLLALGSGAAVTAALLQVTSDQGSLTYVIGASVAIATVVGGAALGTLLRRRDLDTIEHGKYSSSRGYSTGVLFFGVLGVLAIALGVAGLRHAASKADATRRANSTKVTVFIPGEQASRNGAANAGSRPSGPHGVEWTIWFAFELGFGAAATSIEFQRSDVRAEHKEQLKRGTTAKHEEWKNQHGGFGGAVAEHEGALAARADHDLAIILTGSCQRAFADVLSNEYRHANLAERALGGDPFDQLATHGRLGVDATFDGKPGADVLALVVGDKLEDPATIARLIASNRDLGLLQAAYDELGKSPVRPKRADTEPWMPGAYLDLDPAAQALRESTKQRDAGASVDITNDVVEPDEPASIEAAGEPIVPSSVPDDLLSSTNGSAS